jgi:uncharacterized protein YodC (DUF2158 family)
MADIFIRSAAFPHVHLRMDRTGVTGFNSNGSGMVNCQYYADAGTEPANTSFEAFDLVIVPALGQPNGVAFAFRSTVAGESVFLRMDGGTGTVNCQYYSQGSQPEAVEGNDEVFQIVPIPGSPVFAIQSANPDSPNAYLSMDGSKMDEWLGRGGGKVSRQSFAALPAADSLEAFYISSVI